MKQLTGGDLITARQLYRDPIQYKPGMTIFLSTNHLPYIKDQGNSVWRRLVVIPFLVTISKTEQDPYMKQKLMEEREGILAWMVEGCRLYQKEGLAFCDAVEKHTDTYKTRMDRFGLILADTVRLSEDGKVKSSRLYEVYREWSIEMGVHSLSQVKFAEEMKRRKYTSDRESGGNFWEGIALLDEYENLQ